MRKADARLCPSASVFIPSNVGPDCRCLSAAAIKFQFEYLLPLGWAPVLASLLARCPTSGFAPFWGRPPSAGRALAAQSPHNRLDRCLCSSTCRLCGRLERDFLYLNGTRLGGIEHRPLLASPGRRFLPFCHT